MWLCVQELLAFHLKRIPFYFFFHEQKKKKNNPFGKDMLMPSGCSPKAGDIMRLPNLAATFTELAKKGKDGFYKVRCFLFLSHMCVCVCVCVPILLLNTVNVSPYF